MGRVPGEVRQRTGDVLRSPLFRFGMLAAVAATFFVPALSFLLVGGLLAGVAYAARPLLPGRFSFPRLSFGGGDTRSVTKPGSEGNRRVSRSAVTLSGKKHIPVAEQPGRSSDTPRNKVPKGRKVGDPMVDQLIRKMTGAGLVVSTDWGFARKVLNELPEKYDFFRQNHKKVYGFVYNGVIYINPKAKAVATPIHEYTHVWAEVLRQKNPDEWKHIVDMLKNDEEVGAGNGRLWDAIKKSYPHLETDDEIADEVLAQYSGHRGYERLMAFAEGQSDAQGILDRISAALEKFWHAVADFLHIHYTSKEQVADQILKDLLSQVNPLDYEHNIIPAETRLEGVMNEDLVRLMSQQGTKFWTPESMRDGCDAVSLGRVYPYANGTSVQVIYHFRHSGDMQMEWPMEDVIRTLSKGITLVDPLTVPFSQERQIQSEAFKEWFGDWRKPSIYRAYMVDDVAGLKDRYPSALPYKFYDHSTVSYGLQEIDDREGQQKRMHIIGRLTTDKVDVLVVDNPESNNEYAHITLATAEGVKPVESNSELEKHAAEIVPLDDYVDVTFKNVLNRNLSKVVDADGKPLAVEHGTHADFTVFDISRIGSNSKDNGLFGAGFYFGTHAPVWLNDGSEDYRTMKVYLDIKHPFEVSDKASLDIYSEIVKKMDSPAMRGLTITGLNGKQMQVGEYIDVIKAVDDLIRHNPVHVNGQIAHDEELQSYHPKDRQRMWREHEISRLTGMGTLGMSWQVVISEQIGSVQFTEAAKKDGYDGVIVDRGEGYKEYVAFEPTQIKSATDNIGLFNRQNDDIRYHFEGEKYKNIKIRKESSENISESQEKVVSLHQESNGNDYGTDDNRRSEEAVDEHADGRRYDRRTESQPWIIAGILSCMKKGYNLNPMVVNWEARELRYAPSQTD